MKLIDKDKIVAEIERITDVLEKNSGYYGIFGDAQMSICEKILSFLDTLSVKEVDLEKYYHDFLQKEWFDKNCNRTMSEMMAFTAKHFFELGIKVQKGE